MIWILQTNKNNYLKQWYQAFEENNSKFKTIEIIPNNPQLPQLEVDDLAVVIGTTTLMKHAHKSWTPATFFIPENFRVSTWQKVYGKELLNNDGEVCKLNDLLIKSPDRFFIRPNDDLKDFSGVLVQRESIIDQINNINSNPDKFNFTGNLEVFISPIKHIQKEYRFFVVDKKVVSGCQYRLKTMIQFDINLDQSLLDYAQKLVDMWQPADAYVMDLVLDDNGGYKLLEFNCLNASGLYVCDAVKIVSAIESMVDSPKFITNIINNQFNKIEELSCKKRFLLNEIFSKITK